MHCPHCKKRAISFVAWGSGNLWVRYRCRHCDAPLRVHRRTIIVALASLAIGIPLSVVTIDPILNLARVPDGAVRRGLAFIIIFIYLFPAAWWDWKTGYYASRDVRKHGGEDQNA